MALLPSSQDEPAIQDGLVAAIVKLLLGLFASAGLVINDSSSLKAPIVAIVGAIVAAAIGYAQATVTRSKVVPVATVAQLAPESYGWPYAQLPAELTDGTEATA